MEKTLAQFGSIFRHKEKDYIFLAQTDEILYAALILDEGQTRQLQNISDRVETRGSFRKESAVYSFVILTTSDFQNRAAHFAKTDNSEHQTFKLELIGFLNKGDLLRVKNEIVSKNSTLPLKLIELVKQLNII